MDVGDVLDVVAGEPARGMKEGMVVFVLFSTLFRGIRLCKA